MTAEAMVQLAAVLLGGLLAIAGGIFTTVFRDEQLQRRESRNLALAFKGEITSLIELMQERNYLTRIADVIEQIEQSGQPFYMPFRVRFEYDRVYRENVGRIGILKPPLAEQIPLFYTRLTSVLEDLASLGDGTYTGLELAILLRIYRDTHRLIALLLSHGETILAAIDREYPS